jgi:hypothetical protein
LTSIFAVLHNATMPLVKKNPFKTGEPTALLGFSSRSLVIFIAFGLVLLAAVGVAVYFYLQYQQSQDQLNKSTHSNEQAALISEVGKLIDLPTGEQPTVATVSDINKLKSQSFFARARDGDKVLIYTKAQEAILYDPLVNKIVEVGPISLTQVSPTPKGPTPTFAPVRVALYNGTSVVGLASKVAQQLKIKIPSITVVSRSDAQKTTYATTVVVDLTGKLTTQASLLAQTLGGKVGTLPEGEAKPSGADLIVILGK